MSQLPESCDPGLGGVADDPGRVRADLVPVAGLDGGGVEQGGHAAAGRGAAPQLQRGKAGDVVRREEMGEQVMQVRPQRDTLVFAVRTRT